MLQVLKQYFQKEFQECKISLSELRLERKKS